MQWFFLFLKELIGNKWITAIVFVSIVIAFTSVATLAILGINANNYINGKFATSIPPNIIKVSPVPVAQPIFGFALARPEGTVLDDAHLNAIRSINGIKNVYPLMASQIPMQAVISIFGLNYRTDLICIGAPYSFISNEIGNSKFKKAWLTWHTGKELPSLLPGILLDAYNDSMAAPNGLPRITEGFALEKKFQILFGKSSIKSVEGFVSEQSFVAGITKKISSICVVIPLSVMKFYNEKLNGKNSPPDYMTAYIEVKDHKSLLSVSQRLQGMKFIVETEKSLPREIIQLKNNFNLLIRSISAIIIFLAVMAIAFCTIISTLQRIDYYRLLRVLGASKLFISLTVLIKTALLGLLGSLVGLWTFGVIVGWARQAIQVPGFVLQSAIPKEFLSYLLFFGVMSSVLSAIPALVEMNIKSMSED